MNVEQIKEALCNAYYNAPKWVNKVKKMSDSQAIAIYIRLRNIGKI